MAGTVLVFLELAEKYVYLPIYCTLSIDKDENFMLLFVLLVSGFF